MVIPIIVVMALFFASFIMTCYQYYRVDPRRRLLNLRFAIMFVTTIGAISYPLVHNFYQASPLLPSLSQGYTLTALLCLVTTVILLRRMPPAERY